MRKLEGVVKEVSDELGYLKRREARFRDTNGEWGSLVAVSRSHHHTFRVHEGPSPRLRPIHDCLPHRSRSVADIPFEIILPQKVSYRLRVLLFFINGNLFFR